MMARPWYWLMLGALPVLATPTPAPQHYRLEYWNSQEFDFSTMGRPVQRLGFGYTTWLSMSLADSLPEARRLTMMVDSARLTQGSQIPLPVDSLGGASWSGVLRGNGRVESWAPVQDRPASGHLRTLLWHFYPRVPAPLGPGTEWVDTVERRFAEINGAVTFTIITRYRVDGRDASADRPAWRVLGDIEWRQQAELQFTRGMGSMNGVGRGQGRWLVAVDDRAYLGGESVVVSRLLLTRPGVADVPVLDSSHTTVLLGP